MGKKGRGHEARKWRAGASIAAAATAAREACTSTFRQSQARRSNSDKCQARPLISPSIEPGNGSIPTGAPSRRAAPPSKSPRIEAPTPRWKRRSGLIAVAEGALVIEPPPSVHLMSPLLCSRLMAHSVPPPHSYEIWIFESGAEEEISTFGRVFSVVGKH